MTAIRLSAGRKHTIKVGDKELEVTLRPGEVRYEPFLRHVSEIPKVEQMQLPIKPSGVPSAKVTYESWSRTKPKVTLTEIIDIVQAYKGKKDIKFTPTLSNLIDTLKRYRR